MSSSDDHRDPTAPPPLPDSPESSRPEPGPDDTQVVGPEATRPFTPPAPPAPPAYEQPTYSTPSYDLPAYGEAREDTPPSGPDPYAAPASPSAHPDAAPADPYAAPADPYGAPSADGTYPPPPAPGASVPSYGAASPYGGHPAYGAGSPYAAPTNNTSAIVLTIVSGLTTLITIGFCVGVVFVPALVFGIVALTKQTSDPAGSRKMSRWGWISYAVAMGLGVLAVAGLIAFAVVAGDGNGAFTGT